jgi:NAD(P)-dependent dehydrogenase (short-subunit alcohol dehydrogenase family)
MLAGKLVIVPLGVDVPALARRLAASGATVLLVAGQAEADEAGRLAADLAAGPGRAAVFLTVDNDLDPLVEYVEELFRT